MSIAWSESNSSSASGAMSPGVRIAPRTIRAARVAHAVVVCSSPSRSTRGVGMPDASMRPWNSARGTSMMTW